MNKRGSTIKVIEAAENSRRSARSSAAYSLIQLHLSKLRLHGRDDDLALLRTKLRELKKGKNNGLVDNDNHGTTIVSNRPELLLVAGVSGTGKSALVTRGLCNPAEKMGLAFASGKFDINNSALPLSAFVSAMASLAEHIMNDTTKKTDIKAGIIGLFDEEDMLLLARALPGCEDFFDSAVQGMSQSQLFKKVEANPSGKDAVCRLQYAIRRLLKVICASLDGVILFIDDLQWSDAATLDLIKSISLDDEIHSLLLVGAYREDEVPDTHPLALHIREKEQMGVAITMIKIGNLSPANVQSLVAEALGMEDSEGAVEILASTVHRKTGGNAFFVLVFLRSLYDDKLLQYNFGAMKWTWDDDIVKSKTMTQNVASIMVSKLRRFGEASQNILKIASCLGASVKVSVLSTVVDNISPAKLRGISSPEETASITDCEDDTSMSLSSSLREFEDEGLWERETDDICRFSHDQVKSAAFELIAPEKRDEFRGEIGDILISKLNQEALEESLFEVVSLRNCARDISNNDELIDLDLARMNLRAGLKASENAAFDSAAVYFQAGRAHLGENAWKVDQATMLNLCSEEANACFINGELEQMNSLINEVLSKDISIKDKFQAFEVKILSLQAAAKYMESIDTAIELRKQLGLSSPPNKPVSTIRIIKDFLKTTRALKGRSAEEILELPELTDETIIMGQRALELVTAPIFLVQPTLYPLIVFKMVRSSLKHGLNVSSCETFSVLALLLCGPFGKMNEGNEMAKVTKELLLQRPEYKRVKSRCTHILQTYVYHWTIPLQETLAPMLEGYQSGLEAGDLEYAGYNVLLRCLYLFYSGRLLGSVQHEYETCITALHEMNQTGIALLAKPILLSIKKLRGVGIEEKDLDFDDFLRLADDQGNRMLRNTALLWQMELRVYALDWSAALSLLKRIQKPDPVAFYDVYFIFLEALVYFKVAQQAELWWDRRKLKKKGLKATKMLRGWAKELNVNVVHLLHIAIAELAALEGKHSKAEASYRSAIAVAKTNGFLQDQGLAHALAGTYFKRKGDDYWREYHEELAGKMYSEWGAKAVVAISEKK